LQGRANKVVKIFLPGVALGDNRRRKFTAVLFHPDHLLMGYIM
jgi:hypothetical protein